MMILLAVSIPLLALLNLALGSVLIPVADIVHVLTGGDSCDDVVTNIILRTRLPQTLTAMACGAGLAVAGLQMQTVFRNPLAGPSVLGVSSAASLGVALVVMLSGAVGGGVLSQFGVFGNSALTLAAIVGAMGVMMLIVYLSRVVGSSVTLLVVGVLIGYIASAIIGVLKYFASEEDVHAYVIWGLGTFARVTGGQVYVFASIMAVLVPSAMLLIKPLDVLLLGEEYARNLGLNLRRTRMLVILSSGALTATATAYCGPIMFLGLAVPHICRSLFATSTHRILMPATMLCGASLALLCNLIARLPGFEGALPINSVTALIGAPVALSVLLRRRG